MKLWHLLRFGSFDHDLHRGRDKDGHSTEFCTLCGFSRLVLREELVIGPAHHQRPDVGAITTKAKRERSAKVHDIRERQSEK